MAGFLVLVFAGFLLFGGAVLAHLIGASSILTFLLADRARFLAAVPQRILAHIDLFSIMSMPLFIMATATMKTTIPNVDQSRIDTILADIEAHRD